MSLEEKDLEYKKNQQENEKDENEEELIAVFMAAIMCSLNTSTYNLKIKSFRRIEQNSPVWNTTGRKDSMDGRL